MPVTLVNGEVIYNVTSHELNIWDESVSQLHTVLSDGVVNAKPESRVIAEKENYTLVEMSYYPTIEGVELIKRIQRECPRSIIVGSVIAAQAYPGQVFAPSPVKYSRKFSDKRYGAIHSNRFTSFQEKQNG